MIRPCSSTAQADSPAVLSPMVLMNAPELSALVLLEHAIEVARLAVLAEHPDLLDSDAPFARPLHPGAFLTHSLFDRAHELYLVVRRYRALVSAAALAPSGTSVLPRSAETGPEDP